MKLAPVARVLAERSDVKHLIVHTGQHYDVEMSDSFFTDLGIPAPDSNLDVGSASHAQQTAGIMQRFEPVCLETKPDVVLVYGDVNSTVAAALVASKLGVKVGHVEAGLRSGDWTMPEEINRVVTDRLADFLFTPSRDGNENLAREGVPAERVHFVGNVMIDTLAYALPAAGRLDAPAQYGLNGRPYVVVTLHRPSNVDHPEHLAFLLNTLETLAGDLPVVFPVHPRTRERIANLGRPKPPEGLRLMAPIGYLEMLSLVRKAALVITDSGGLQEETSFLSIPCLTVRPNTERPVTITHGTNQLVPPNGPDLLDTARKVLAAGPITAAPIERWDGKAAERIVRVICEGESYT